ncbi:MAG: hypothetical protein ACYDEY_07010 [Acidimicrobiales bacterium]
MDPEVRRHGALKVFGATGLAGVAALLGAKVRDLGVAARAAVAKRVPARLAGTLVGKQRGAGATGAAAAEDLYKLGPGCLTSQPSPLLTFGAKQGESSRRRSAGLSISDVINEMYGNQLN